MHRNRWTVILTKDPSGKLMFNKFVKISYTKTSDIYGKFPMICTLQPSEI